MSVLLVGDATETFPISWGTSGSWQEAWKMTAVKSGQLNELLFRTNGIANTGVTSVWLGIYADNAGEPGTLLASGEVDGLPPINSWIAAIGLSASIVEGHAYWLAVHPRGGTLRFNVSVVEGGAPDWNATNNIDGFISPWPATSPDDIYASGPLGFQGLGAVAAPVVLGEPSYIVRITPLLRPEDDPIAIEDTTLVLQNEDVEIVHGLNGGKTGSVTINTNAGAWVADLEPFAQAVWIGLLRPGNTDPEPVIHGQCNVITNFAEHTVTLEIQDPSQRMQHHYLRRGDGALADTTDDPDTGLITADGEGVAAVVAAAQNIDVQDARNDPSLGLDFYSDGSDPRPFYALQVERGQEIYALMQAIASHAAGPDMDWRTPPSWPLAYYTQLELDVSIGRDLTDAVTLSYGYTEDNVEAFTERPGRPTTHAHFLDATGNFRRTAADTSSSNDVGPWVDFVAADMVITSDGAADLLTDLAKARVKAYGVPPKFLELALRPDAATGLYYGHPTWATDAVLDDSNTNGVLYPGDKVHVRARDGYRSYDGPARITEITMSRPGARGPARLILKLVPVRGGVALDDTEQG